MSQSKRIKSNRVRSAQSHPFGSLRAVRAGWTFEIFRLDRGRNEFYVRGLGPLGLGKRPQRFSDIKPSLDEAKNYFKTAYGVPPESWEVVDDAV